MNTTHGRLRLAFPFIAGAVLAVASSGQATAAEDYHTTYALQKGGCMVGPIIDWTPSRVTGPGFNCTLGESRSAGSGLSAYNGTCKVDGTTVTDMVVFDLGNNPERFSIAVPGKDWVSMYPCTPVEGLNGTN